MLPIPGVVYRCVGYGWSPVQSQLNWEQMITAVNNETHRLNGIYQRMWIILRWN